MGINFKGVIKGTIFAILVTFVIILILALLAYFTGIDETIITTGGYASVIIGVILGTICMVDYYGAGVLMVFIFYFFRGRKWWCLAGQLLTLYWVNVELLGGLMYPICLFGMDIELCQQGLALLALIPIWLYRGRQGYHSKAFQLSCYAFYPVHMLILVLILNYVNSF